MIIDVISIFPEMFTALKHSIPQIAQDKGLLSLHFWNPRDYTNSKHGNVDDRPYGGGPGMVMLYQPLRDTISAIKALRPQSPVIYLSPQGRPLTQAYAHELNNQHNSIILLCGRYEGIDQRIIDHWVDIELSIGDFVVSGGELPAMVLIDTLTRLIDDVLGDSESAVQDSFTDGLLDHPHYTRPESIDDHPVPRILLSGNHAEIKRWRRQQSLGNTWQKRQDLVKSHIQSPIDQELLAEFKRKCAEEQK